MALAKKSKKAKKTTESVGDEKQQRGIEATEATEEATAGAIYVEDDSYQPGTYLGTFTTTAYCGCSYCCGKSDGITASGTYATEKEEQSRHQVILRLVQNLSLMVTHMS